MTTLTTPPTPPIHPLWYICLIVRFLFGILVMRCIRLPWISRCTQHRALTFLLAAMGVGFAYQWLTHNPSKPEFQIARVWWNTYRPIHAVMFFMAAGAHHFGAVHTAGALIVVDTVFSAVNRLIASVK